MKRKAFTLIELLVVITIISILASVVLIGVTKAKARGRDARRAADLLSIRIALEDYFVNHGDYPGTLDFMYNSRGETTQPLVCSPMSSCQWIDGLGNLPTDPINARLLPVGSSYPLGLLPKFKKFAANLLPKARACTWPADTSYCSAMYFDQQYFYWYRKGFEKDNKTPTYFLGGKFENENVGELKTNGCVAFPFDFAWANWLIPPKYLYAKNYSCPSEPLYFGSGQQASKRALIYTPLK